MASTVASACNQFPDTKVRAMHMQLQLRLVNSIPSDKHIYAYAVTKLRFSGHCSGFLYQRTGCIGSVCYT
jgi:hypothetical protein